MFAAFFCGSIVAQEQGSMMLDGGLSLDYSTENWKESDDGEGNDNSVDTEGTDNTGTFSLDVAGGYFIMDGLALGLAINSSSSTNTSNSGASGESDIKTKESSMMFGPMVRYYVGETGVFGQLSYMLGSGKEDTDGTQTDKTKESMLSIGAGYGVALADNVHLNPMLKYNMKTETGVAGDWGYGDKDDTDKYSGIQFSVGLTIMM